MRFPKGCELDRVAAREPGRYSIHGVRVERLPDGSGRAVATDGRALAIVPVELEEGDDLEAGGRTLSREAWIEARRGAREGEAYAELNGCAKVRGRSGIVSSSYLEGEFPKYADIVPEHDPHAPSFALNAEYLASIQRALGADSIRLQVQVERGRVQPTRPYRITGGREGSVAVLMPVTSDGEIPDTTERVDGLGSAATLAEVLREWSAWDRAGLPSRDAEEIRRRARVALDEYDRELKRAAAAPPPACDSDCSTRATRAGLCDCTRTGKGAPNPGAPGLEVHDGPAPRSSYGKPPRKARGKKAPAAKVARAEAAPAALVNLREVEVIPADAPTTPPPSAPKPAAAPTCKVLPSPAPGFVEVEFASKPHWTIRAALKGAGFRWSKDVGRWLGRADALPAEIAS